MRENWARILDDAETLRAADPGDMLGKLLAFPELLREAREAPLPKDCRGYRGEPRPPVGRVLYGGMGGSGIAGDLFAAFGCGESGIPFISFKGYSLPRTEPGDLLILCSYSGDTEEVLALLAEALCRDLRLVLITSGGELLQRIEGEQADDKARGKESSAGKLRCEVLALPRELPPRAALPCILGRLLALMRWPGLRHPGDDEPGSLHRALQETVALCAPQQPVDQNPAKQLALALGDERPVFVALSEPYEAVALRLRSQFEENAKRFALSRSLPELHHNSWIPWLGDDPLGLPLWLGASQAHPRVSLRRRLSEEALREKGIEALDLPGRGARPLAELLTTLLLGDFLSVYHALMRGVDPTPTTALDAMKRRLQEAKDSQ